VSWSRRRVVDAARNFAGIDHLEPALARSLGRIDVASHRRNDDDDTAAATVQWSTALSVRRDLHKLIP